MKQHHFLRLAAKAALTLVLTSTALPLISVEASRVQIKESTAGIQPRQNIKFQGKKATSKYLSSAFDLGGYTTANNRWKIRENHLIRSMKLDDLSVEDGKMLNDQYRVKTIIDFRYKGTNSEIVPGATYKAYQVQPGDQSGMDEYTFYRTYLTSNKLATTAYALFLDTVLKSQDGAVLFHDVNGNEEAGIATYLLMTALGMDEDTKASDFALSATHAGIRRGERLQDYIKGVTFLHPTPEKYIEDKLGVTPEKREALRSKYLISTDGKQTPYTTAANEADTEEKPEVPEVPTPTPGSTEKPETGDKPAGEKPDVIPGPGPETPGVSHPEPQPQPQPQPQPLLPTPVPPVTQPTQPQPARPGAKPRPRQRVKVLAVKRVSHGRYVFTKGHKPTYRDVHLKHRLTTTGKRSLKQWRIVRQAKLVVNGRRVTYLQLKPHHGSARWIAQSHIIESQR